MRVIWNVIELLTKITNKTTFIFRFKKKNRVKKKKKKKIMLKCSCHTQCSYLGFFVKKFFLGIKTV